MHVSLDALERWIETRFGRVLIVLLVLALFVRAAVQLELGSGPCARQHRWVETDMHFFDGWARAVAGGDVASRHVGHPYLDWHADIAARYFEMHPGERGAFARSGGDPARALWAHWYGGAQFHQEPLYPYLVALTYRVFGPDPRWVFAWQALLGAGNVLLLAVLARVAFGALTGALSGLLAALCSTLVFHENVLLRTTLIVFLVLLVAVLGAHARSRASPGRWFGLGLACGAALACNTTLLPLVVGVLALGAGTQHRAGARLVQPAAAALLGIVVLLAPVWARNLSVGAPVFSTSSVGALAFVCSNAEDFDPSVGFAVDSRHLPAILHASDNHLLAAVPATLGTHAGVASWLRQLGAKFDWSWRWYELPNNENEYAYAAFSAVLVALPVSFGFLAPLALVGAVLAWRRRAAAAELYVALVSALLPLLAFYVLSRFRAPLVAVAIPFAALALVALARALAARELRRAAFVAGVVLVLALWTGRPLSPGRERIRPADWTAPFLVAYVPLAEEAARAGRWSEAARVLEAGLEHEPDWVRGAPDPQRRPFDRAEREWLRFAARLRERLAQALERGGRSADAPAVRARGAELARLADAP